MCGKCEVCGMMCVKGAERVRFGERVERVVYKRRRCAWAACGAFGLVANVPGSHVEDESSKPGSRYGSSTSRNTGHHNQTNTALRNPNSSSRQSPPAHPHFSCLLFPQFTLVTLTPLTLLLISSTPIRLPASSTYDHVSRYTLVLH